MLIQPAHYLEWRVKVPTQKRQPKSAEAATGTYAQFLEELLDEMALYYNSNTLPTYMQILKADDLRAGFFVISPPSLGRRVPVTGWSFALEDLELYEPVPAVLASA